MESEAKKEGTSEVLVLDSPLKWGKELIKELEFRRPKGKDIRHISLPPTLEEVMEVAGKCVNHPSGSILFDELDGYDYLKVGEVVGGFLGSGPEIGSKPSQ